MMCPLRRKVGKIDREDIKTNPVVKENIKANTNKVLEKEVQNLIKSQDVLKEEMKNLKQGQDEMVDQIKEITKENQSLKNDNKNIQKTIEQLAKELKALKLENEKLKQDKVRESKQKPIENKQVKQPQAGSKGKQFVPLVSWPKPQIITTNFTQGIKRKASEQPPIKRTKVLESSLGKVPKNTVVKTMQLNKVKK